MLYFLHNRTSTHDVDFIPLDFPDSMQPTTDTKTFRAAINAVAKTYRLKRDWMNDVVASFTPELGPLTLWRAYPNLQIFVPEAEYIFVLKLLSGRPKDAEDITALLYHLRIRTRAQAQALVDRYADRRWQQECQVDATLDALF